MGTRENDLPGIVGEDCRVAGAEVKSTCVRVPDEDRSAGGAVEEVEPLRSLNM